MKYKDANDRLHAAPELKEKTIAAMEGRQAPRRRKNWAARGGALAAAAVAAALLLQLPLPGGGGGGLVNQAYAVSVAEYPPTVAIPNVEDYTDPITKDFDDDGYMEAWSAWQDSRRSSDASQLDPGYAAALHDFSQNSIRQFMGEVGTDNRVYSPANLYVALAMLAELTGGNSRQQVLELLGLPAVEGLREQTGRLWRQLYCDDGQLTTRLANSVWLNEDVPFHQDTLDTLAQHYFASSFQGEMGTPELNRALRDWLNEQTGGLLKDSVDGISTQRDTALALLSTVYFKGRWQEEFRPERTDRGLFANADGSETETDFMHRTGDQIYAWGEGYAAISLPFEGGPSMLLILPDEGVAAEELLSNDGVMELLTGSSRLDDCENQKYLQVILSMPRFDVSSDLELSEGLKALGITDVFDGAVSDFSPMTDLTPVWLDEANHAARVTVDEEGCTAAAYVEMMMACGATVSPDEEVEFNLNRPFLFAVTGVDGLPLFVGMVNSVKN